MMTRLMSLADVVTEGGRLVSAVGVNADDLPAMEPPRSNLEALLDEAHSLSRQQKALAASKQEVSKRLDEILIECRKLITVLRVMLRQHYGFSSEKLVEFGIRPQRPRFRRTEPVTPPPPPSSEVPLPPSTE